MLIAGAYGRMGCAILAARAALRSGCGLVSVHLPWCCVNAMQAAFPEAMVSIDPSEDIFTTPPPQLEQYTAIAAGPGLGTDELTCQALHDLLMNRRHYTNTPLILDADALNILALHFDWLSLASGAIITPHAREYQRLFSSANPADVARRYNLTIVAKSHHTHVYAPDGRDYENTTGNAGMATAGSGDVLTGILLGITAQKNRDLFQSVCLGVKIHGKIGDRLVQKQSESGLIASDMVEELKYISVEFPTD